MKIRDLNQLAEKELDEKFEEIQKELMKFNAQIASGTTPKSPGQVKNLKKTIAKILMLKNRKKNKKQNE